LFKSLYGYEIELLTVESSFSKEKSR
jgi:hypothetical protein